MSGYTLDQLLRWTLEDHVIDGYAFGSEDDVEIYRSGRMHVMNRQNAEALLRDLIGRITPEGLDVSSVEPEISSPNSEKRAGET